MGILTMFIGAKYVGLYLLAIVGLPHSAPAAVIEQLIAVIDGEPYTLTNVSAFAKNRLAKSFPSGNLQQINAADREVLEQFITDKLMEAEVREAGIRIT
ncbi:MAG: hypothetical protein M3N35_14015, partial [Candidatus Binatota bacterium]|nr:hypothetical protein [Candidatus Binatota bacterium]